MTGGEAWPFYSEAIWAALQARETIASVSYYHDRDVCECLWCRAYNGDESALGILRTQTDELVIEGATWPS